MDNLLQALIGQQGQMQGQQMPQMGASNMQGQMPMMSGPLGQALMGGIGGFQPKYIDMFGQGRL